LRVGQALGLVQTLIAYGKNLAETLRQHTADPRALPFFTFLAVTFGSSDLPRIFGRVILGLLRARALEARLHHLATRGRGLKPTPFRPPSPRKPHPAKPANMPGEPAPAPKSPTVEEILAKDRRRPIGRVLVEICHDLGIVPRQMDHSSWDELRYHVIEYGGSLAALLLRRRRKQRSVKPASLTGSPSFAPIPITGPIAFPPMARAVPAISGSSVHRPAVAISL
jgi:hypothetical protein